MAKKNNVLRRKSIFKSLICVYLLFVIPLFLSFFISNKIALDELSTQKMDALKSYLITNKEIIENEVNRIYMTQQALISQDTAIQDIADRYQMMGSYELGRVVAIINNNLRYLQNTSDLIKDVSVYIPKIEREFATNLYYNDNIDYDTKAKYQASRAAPSNIVTYHNGNIYVTSHSHTLYRNQTPKYYIYTQLDPVSIKRLFSKVEKNVHILFFSNRYYDGYVISSDTDNTMINNITNTVSRSDALPDIVTSTKLNGYNEEYLFAFVESQQLCGTFAIYVPKSAVLDNLNTHIRLLWELAAASAIAVLFLSISLYKMIKKPLNTLTRAFGKVETGNLDIKVNHVRNDEFGDLMHSFNVMVKKLKNVIQQVYINSINLKTAQLKQLQAQIEPHFLYNSLSILTHLISRGRQDTALLMSRLLSKYFKYVTQNNYDVDTLKNEFEFAKTYIDIQKIRFGNKVQVQFSMIDPGYQDILVPRMIIQPLIENCYKHAFCDMIDGGILKVHWKVIDNVMNIVIKDNGPGVGDKHLQHISQSLNNRENVEHYGLCNVHQRLILKYGNNYGLRIYSQKNRFFCVVVRLPINKNDS